MFRIIKLAVKDYFYEWQISACFVLALAAVLGPMLVLFALKYGIIAGMFGQLIDDPRNRELRPVYSGRYTKSWIAEIKNRADVEFVVPKTRSIAASMQLKSKNAPRIINVELIPTGENDPLLSNLNTADAPKGFGSIILSKSVAKKLAVKSGDIITGSVQRQYKRKRERKQLSIKVSGVANSRAFTRDGAFASLAMLEAFENFRDGRAVPTLGWLGEVPAKDDEKYYTGFRLFAKSIEDVSSLKKWLEKQGVDVMTQVDEIESVQNMDYTLSTIYWVIALMGVIGFATSLGSNLWSNVERKRKELSIIRVIGFQTHEIISFPIIQSLLTVIFGWLLAVGVYLGVSYWINSLMSDQLETGSQVCVLLPEHYLISLGMAIILAIVVASFAGVRVSYIEPSDGMREI